MTPTLIASPEPARIGTLGLPPCPKLPLEASLFIVSGQRHAGSEGFIDTFSEEILGADLEEFIRAVGEYRHHRGCRLPQDWRSRLARDGQIELDAGVMVVEVVS